MAKLDYEFRVQEQVAMRRPILGGRGSNVIKIGTILAFAEDGKKAIVSFPADSTRLTVSLDQLEPVRERFGRARVHINPTLRNISSLQ